MTITFTAHGLPKGQPRARATIRGRHAGVYDPGTANEWKHAVADAWRLSSRPVLTGPLMVQLWFYFPRPKNHFRTGKNAAQLKDSAPKYHTNKPDLDNLAKAVLDELTRIGAWKDDAAVCHLQCVRLWAEGERTQGCTITIRGEGAGLCEDCAAILKVHRIMEPDAPERGFCLQCNPETKTKI
jgi:Holliday junction resolvase RusA-like endonuclease